MAIIVNPLVHVFQTKYYSVKNCKLLKTGCDNVAMAIVLLGQHRSWQPRTQGTFGNESTLVDRGHVVSLYCPDFGQ